MSAVWMSAKRSDREVFRDWTCLTSPADALDRLTQYAEPAQLERVVLGARQHKGWGQYASTTPVVRRGPWVCRGDLAAAVVLMWHDLEHRARGLGIDL